MTEEQAIKTEYSDNEAEPKAPETVLEENASTDASAVETSQAGSKTDDNLEVNSVSGDADAEKKSETNGHSVEHEAAEKHPVKKHNPNATHSLKKPNGSKCHSGKGTNGHTLKSVNGQAAKGTKGTKGASKAPRRKKTIYEKIRKFLGVMAVAFAVAVLVTHYFLPIVSVESPSMEGTIHEGDVVLGATQHDYNHGDIIIMYVNNKLMVRRLIASSGDEVDIRDDGTVYVNKQTVEQDYVTEPTLGNSDLEYPYTVPAGQFFVLGDNRKDAVDSRMSQFGCIAKEQIAGKVIFRVWPITSFGLLK